MSKKTTVILSVLLALVAVLGAVSSAIAFMVGQSGITELEARLYEAEEAREALSVNVDVLEATKLQLEEQKKELEKMIADSGELFGDEIDALKDEIEKKSADIAALEADIERYRTVFNIDVREQARLIESIVDYIETKCPYVRVYTPIDSSVTAGPEEAPEAYTDQLVAVSTLIEKERSAVTADVPLFTDEELAMSGLTREELTYKRLLERVLADPLVYYPNVSVYYEDLSTGYHFDYNSKTAYNSASVVKAPYIMSVFEAVSKDEKAYLEALASEGKAPEMIDTDGDGIPDKVKIEYSNPKYNLYETLIYDKATMYKSGSGAIQNMADGTEFTYMDLARHVLIDSDNIAYAQIRNRFGYSTMTALAYRAGANISGSTMTAKGAGRLFKEIYEFTQEDDTYGTVLRDAMVKSGHTVIIPYGVSPYKAMHKYGWDEDSYHDAAIVLYGDKPYVLAVFSDLDNGGNAVNEYLRGIVKMVNKLHGGFYQN